MRLGSRKKKFSRKKIKISPEKNKYRKKLIFKFLRKFLYGKKNSRGRKKFSLRKIKKKNSRENRGIVEQLEKLYNPDVDAS